MKIIKYPKPREWSDLCQRPVQNLSNIYPLTQEIFQAVKKGGDQALKMYSHKYDKVDLSSFKVTEEELNQAASKLPSDLKNAIDLAYKNIRTFHKVQKEPVQKIETAPGVICWRESRAIEKVGLYIPGGTAPLFSTVLMLGIPAQLAGCKEVVLCTPPDRNGSIHPAILYAARKTGVSDVFKLGGIQAIAAMSLGSESIPRVYKIFGPGNPYVMAAKQTAYQYGTAIDLPAGPSEVLIIADEESYPDFVAADLLSQAEHGPDSQVILLSNSVSIAEQVIEELKLQSKDLERRSIVKQALSNSKIIVLDNIQDCIDFSNLYAPEHLILALKDPNKWTDKVVNAGSVFLGNYSSESAGDYASGTNHTLPTGGFARAYSGVSLDSFVKKITFQEVSKEGIKSIGKVVETMAAAEGLQAHQRAMTLKINKNENR